MKTREELETQLKELRKESDKLNQDWKNKEADIFLTQQEIFKLIKSENDNLQITG